jgi:uroporphyrinogen decarboxylase
MKDGTDEMNNRQRFLATMHYAPRDRMPIADFGFWDETLVVWREQGLPAHISNLPGERNTDGYFGMDFNLDDLGGATGVFVGLAPGFAFEVIEDRGDTEIIQQADGVRVLRHKFMSSIPTDVGHLLVDRQSWREHYLPRLDPTYPGRYPSDWDARLATWCDPQREQIIALPGGSLYGWLRDWIGMEQLSYIIYDDPAWFEEMVTAVADCIFGTLSRVLATGGQFDACAMWEDMCYRGGPLLSPRHFKQYLVPHYRRIADLLHSHGVDVIWVDCDGKIDDLLPLWLNVGINCMFPIEVGTWGADPLRYRQQYGRDLLMIGGVDKHILSGSQAEIVQEVQRLLPLVDEGGYIALPDHRVPADVPLHNYLFYLEQVRTIWGRGIDLPATMGYL